MGFVTGIDWRVDQVNVVFSWVYYKLTTKNTIYFSFCVKNRHFQIKFYDISDPVYGQVLSGTIPKLWQPSYYSLGWSLSILHLFRFTNVYKSQEDSFFVNFAVQVSNFSLGTWWFTELCACISLFMVVPRRVPLCSTHISTTVRVESQQVEGINRHQCLYHIQNPSVNFFFLVQIIYFLNIHERQRESETIKWNVVYGVFKGSCERDGRSTNFRWNILYRLFILDQFVYSTIEPTRSSYEMWSQRV